MYTILNLIGMKKILYILFISLFIVSSCKKDDDPELKNGFRVLTQEEADNVSEQAMEVTSTVQNFMNSTLSVAFDSGYFVQPPSVSSKKSTGSTGSTDWMGPDANGWYVKYWESYGYNYTERVRYGDTIDYELKFEYHGGDGSFSNITRTQLIRYEKDGKTLYKGYSDWKMSSSGYSDMSTVEWKMTYSDWNPQTGAGNFDWYWGVIDGMDSVPLYRYLSVTARESGDILRVKVTIYAEGNEEVWSFEYETPINPVDMPELP